MDIRAVFLSGLLLPAVLTAAESRYAHPALNPVTFEEPVGTKKIELVKDGKLNFAIVCDLKKETVNSRSPEQPAPHGDGG